MLPACSIQRLAPAVCRAFQRTGGNVVGFRLQPPASLDGRPPRGRGAGRIAGILLARQLNFHARQEFFGDAGLGYEVLGSPDEAPVTVREVGEVGQDKKVHAAVRAHP